ncbi:hypothetical protein Ahy_B05g077079 [Arachis hypogaea]|uniref:Uncharacterized protein n=1 Tax=Arachis hypogaea TaxID=3818 RepID=A0A444Z4E7_ARAHY|nr:hypothetical protein Ahy_B05g077079 [Arachis hypogaea]
MFLHDKVFTVFIVPDAISLFASSTSVLISIGILTLCLYRNRFPAGVSNETTTSHGGSLLIGGLHDGFILCITCCHLYTNSIPVESYPTWHFVGILNFF